MKIVNVYIAISKNISKKLQYTAGSSIPIVLIPPTVEFKEFDNSLSYNQLPTKLFYGGSMGYKDGLSLRVLKICRVFSDLYPGTV